MASRTEIAKEFLDAQSSRDAAKIDAVAVHIAEDASMAGGRMGGEVTGRPAVVDRLKNPPQRGGGGGGGFGGGGGGGGGFQITWDEPVEEGATVKVKGTPPPNPMVSSITTVFTFNAEDKITRIERVRA